MLGYLGRYELISILGEGGFATVYRVRDPRLGREVALKALRPVFAGDVETRQRFLDEARTAAGLRHPSIVVVHDVDETDGQPYFTMELIRGRTLAEIVKERPGLPLSEVAEIFQGLANAVDYIHAQGQVHRDIKAANVMVEDSGS